MLDHMLTVLGELPIDPVVVPFAQPTGINAPAAPIPGLETVASSFIGWLKWVLMFGGVAGLLICGIMMAVGRRNRSAFAAEGAAGIPWVIGGLSLGMVATSIVTGILK